MTMLIPIRDQNPTRRFPIVTAALIVANVFVFFNVGVSQEVAFHFGAVPCDIVGRCARLSNELQGAFPGRSDLLSILTSMFMHGSFLHLGGNMLYLWVFGNNVEDRIGRVGFAIFYLVCGVVAAGTHIILNTVSPIPMVGASGAISGVLGAYLYLYPKARITAIIPILWFIPFRLSAKVVLVVWFAMQLLEALGGLGATQESGGVAVFAHIGGFVAGYLIAKARFPQRPPVSVPDVLERGY